MLVIKMQLCWQVIYCPRFNRKASSKLPCPTYRNSGVPFSVPVLIWLLIIIHICSLSLCHFSHFFPFSSYFELPSFSPQCLCTLVCFASNMLLLILRLALTHPTEIDLISFSHNDLPYPP